ncbi:hypothetical protein NLU13_3887 [Sarocladium strictum]|uniref:dihydroneopterin aldolase n=1 Tax=Sarocladium strictum TaxID=5046 RepID=A0AA39GKE5_SARSR|nr:hypothetical protein NLU13_3887 [Sarocladium strictum]
MSGSRPPAKRYSLLSHARVLALAEDSPSIIRVRNLQVTLRGPKDAWGRAGKSQPALVSVEVRMRNSFGLSSEMDQVQADTVHYGLLAKGVLRIMEETNHSESLGSSVGTIWASFTGHADLKGSVPSGDPFLNIRQVEYLRVAIKVTKASLLGEGVSLSCAAAFADGVPTAVASSLEIHGLRIPTLVGVNANERTAKQIVLAHLRVEDFTDLKEDLHVDLEAVVTRVISESSFETLEALAQVVIAKLKKKHSDLVSEKRVSGEWLFGIELQKPIAVPFAEAACVELRGRAKVL